MKTKEEEYSAHINELLTSGKTLSLTEIMLCFYKKPCRKFFPGISGGRTTADLHALRGSVVITDKEVILFVDPLDEYLVGPPEGENLDMECENPTTMYQHGTTIIRAGNGKYHVTYYLNEGSIKDRILADKKIWNRWAGYNSTRNHLKCFEHMHVMETRVVLSQPFHRDPPKELSDLI